MKRIAKKTTPRTSASRTRSNASTAGAARLLADLSAPLEALRLRWYVFGAQCAIVYGRPRMTADVDVTVELRDIGKLAFIDVLSNSGFELRMDFGEDFLREARLLPLVHRLTGMPVDVLIASTRLHAEFLSRVRWVDTGDARVPMMSPEDLVVTKVLAGRRKDLEDVRGVLDEQESLDIERIRELVSQLGEALDQPVLLRRIDRLLRQRRGTRKS